MGCLVLGVLSLCLVYTNRVRVRLMENDARTGGGCAWIGTRRTRGGSGSGSSRSSGDSGSSRILQMRVVVVRVVSALVLTLMLVLGHWLRGLRLEAKGSVDFRVMGIDIKCQ